MKWADTINKFGIVDIEKGYKILIKGEPGTLKSTLVFWLVHLACDEENRAIYFSFEEDIEIFRNHLRHMEVIKKDGKEKDYLQLLTYPGLKPGEDRKKIYGSPDDFIKDLLNLLDENDKNIKDSKVSMIVFDPWSTIKDYLLACNRNIANIRNRIPSKESITSYKREIFRYNIHTIFNHPFFEKVVSFFIVEKTNDSKFNVEDYLVDTIFELRISETSRAHPVIIRCAKMRGYNIKHSDFTLYYHPHTGFDVREVLPATY